MPARLPRVEIGSELYDVEPNIIIFKLYNMTIFGKRFAGRGGSCLLLKN
jgi:hypothetical protein